MHESDRNRLEKERQSLLLAAADMEQATAAALALQNESDVALSRALETAIAVCYMRPFTNADLALPPGYEPTAEPDAQIHRDLATLRDKYYAHTDQRSGRTTHSIDIRFEGEVAHMTWEESWKPLPRENLPHLLKFFESSRDAFRLEAGRIHVRLESITPPS